MGWSVPSVRAALPAASERVPACAATRAGPAPGGVPTPPASRVPDATPTPPRAPTRRTPEANLRKSRPPAAARHYRTGLDPLVRRSGNPHHTLGTRAGRGGRFGGTRHRTAGSA